MNKYRDKSDFEINCQVMATFEPDIEHMCLSHDEKSFYHCGFDGNGFYETTIPGYCNNPADAMPIVVENGICMNYIDKDIGWGAYHFDEEKGELEIYDKNYYRAAMICFLMMKDAENEKV